MLVELPYSYQMHVQRYQQPQQHGESCLQRIQSVLFADRGYQNEPWIISI